MILLTERQRQILTKMRDEGEDVIAYGIEVWCGYEKISMATLNFFLRHCLVSQNGMEPHHYDINESGKLLLEGRQDIYRLADGRYVEDWRP